MGEEETPGWWDWCLVCWSDTLVSVIISWSAACRSGFEEDEPVDTLEERRFMYGSWGLGVVLFGECVLGKAHMWYVCCCVVWCLRSRGLFLGIWE